MLTQTIYKGAPVKVSQVSQCKHSSAVTFRDLIGRLVISPLIVRERKAITERLKGSVG